MKKYFLSLLLLALILGCNKNQKINRKIDGKWNFIGVNLYTTGSQDFSPLSVNKSSIYNFQDCNLKHNDYCPLIITNTNTTNEITTKSIYSKIYKIYGDGKLIEIKNNLTDSTSQLYIISEITPTDLIIIEYDINGNQRDLIFNIIE